MTTNPRRSFLLGSIGAIAAAGMLTACNSQVDAGTDVTTTTLDVPDMLSLVGSVVSGLTIISQTPAVTENVSKAVGQQISDALANASKIQAALAADIKSPVSVETGRGWVKDISNGLSSALSLLAGLTNVLPAKVSNLVIALQSILPLMQLAVGLVAAPATKLRLMGRSEAQAAIAAAA